MNYMERRNWWDAQIMAHNDNPCEYCDNDTACHVWENLIAAANTAAEIPNYDDIPYHIAITER
jgi:hypothetical protein